MQRLSLDDGTWQTVLDQWSKQCHDFGEDFTGYLPETLPMLEKQIEDCSGSSTTGVFSHIADGDQHEAICFLNGAFIPGFTGRVLRVRHLILAPKYDFGEFAEDEYAGLLASIFEAVLSTSDSVIECPNVKFHFRSPADVSLYRSFAKNLDGESRFSSVEMKGAWLFVNKA